MTAKRFRVHEWVKYNYSEIGEYTDENHTDNPLRNDEVVELLNELYEENQYLKSLKWNQDCINEISIGIQQRQSLEEENEQLKQTIAETEKMVQSTYDELTKLRCLKRNLGRIKSQWDSIMEEIQYD